MPIDHAAARAVIASRRADSDHAKRRLRLQDMVHQRHRAEQAIAMLGQRRRTSGKLSVADLAALAHARSQVDALNDAIFTLRASGDQHQRHAEREATTVAEHPKDGERKT